MRSRSTACIVLLTACFGDPPHVESGTDAATTSSSSSDAASENVTGSESASTNQTSMSSSASESGATTTGASSWCSSATLFGPPPFSPSGCATTFGGVARIGGMLWIAGSHVSPPCMDAAHPAAWMLGPADIFGATVELPLGSIDYELVTFLDDTSGPPLLIYNEGLVRAAAYDDPSDMALAEVGAWDLGMASDDWFGEVVRANGSLWAAATRTGPQTQPEWALVTSLDGVAWTVDPAFRYTFDEMARSAAHAIAVRNDNLITVAGTANDVRGQPHWVVLRYALGTDPGGPHLLADGSANAVVLADEEIIVGGALGGGGAIQRAPEADAPFEDFGSFVLPVIDLAAGPDGAIVALSGTPDNGFSVHVCDDRAAGPECWRTLVEAATNGGDVIAASSLLVEQEQVWITATYRFVAGQNLGALYRAECAG